MHEELDVSRRGEELFIRTGQYALKPSRDLAAALARAIQAQASEAGVYALGFVPFLGEGGRVRMSKLEAHGADGIDSVSIEGADPAAIRDFEHWMARLGVPVGIYRDNVTGEKYLSYRRSDAGAIVEALKRYLIEDLTAEQAAPDAAEAQGHDEQVTLSAKEEFRRLTPDEVQDLVERVCDPTRDPDPHDIEVVSGRSWEKAGEAYRYDGSDDLGHEIHATCSATGEWRVQADDGTGVVRDLCAGNEPLAANQGVGAALLKASAAVGQLTNARAAMRERRGAVMTPQQQRESAERVLERDRGAHRSGLARERRSQRGRARER